MSKNVPMFPVEEGSSSSSSSVDLLTSLPECLRLHILSLLPYRSAIQTSVLSSQWRHLYKNRAENLVIFLPSHIELPALRTDGLPLDSLQLIVRPNSELVSYYPQLRHWLTLACSRGVQDITIDLYLPTRTIGFHKLGLAIGMPFHLLTSLTRLTLIRAHIAPPPGTVNLSSLQVLNLDSVFITEEGLRTLLKGCYMLRTLDIRRCPGLMQMVVPGAGMCLRSVTVVDCPTLWRIWIRARHLQRFHCFGRSAGTYCLDFSFKLKLEDVYMNRGYSAVLDEALDVPRLNSWWTALGRLSHVRILTLCSLSLQCIVTSGDFRNFPCLRELQFLMTTMTKSNLLDICSFFRLCFCPGLEKLFIEFKPHVGNMKESCDAVEELPSADVFPNLKIIKINRFEENQFQMLLVKILLWKATHLESLLLITPQVRQVPKYSVDSHSHALHFLRMELDSMVKSSQNAKIIVRDHDDHWVRPTHDEVY